MKVLEAGCDLDIFFKKLKKSKNKVLFLDYDGTLAPFQKERAQAFPYPGVRKIINTILDTACCRLVVISGRAIDDLIPLLGLSNLPEIWGSHGWERFRPGVGREIAEIQKAAVSGLARAAEWVESEGLRDKLEQKPVSVAIHWRGLPDRQIKEIRGKVEQNWGFLAQQCGLTLHDFDGGLELKVPGRTKGDAVKAVLAEEGQDAIAAYLGDDLTDEDAFLALKGQGLSILVRSELRTTAADLWLEPPGELLSFLDDWNLACLRKRRDEDT